MFFVFFSKKSYVCSSFTAAIVNSLPYCASDCVNHLFLYLFPDACDLYTWGDGTTGMLGHGENGEENVPKVVEALISKDISKVACGITHTVIATSE